jgi:hypothetical protein
VKEFQRIGLIEMKGKLDANPGKTLKEIFIAEGTWDNFCDSARRFGTDAEEDVLGLEANARKVG